MLRCMVPERVAQLRGPHLRLCWCAEFSGFQADRAGGLTQRRASCAMLAPRGATTYAGEHQRRAVLVRLPSADAHPQ